MNFFEFHKVSKPVYLNIYSFLHGCNMVCGCIGLGVYHTAIQIDGIEYMFHGFAGKQTGISEVQPLTCPYRFEQKILLGHTDYSFHQLQEKVIQPLEKQFISNTYDLLNNNCNHFALVMAQKMEMGHNHPRGKIFRVTDCLNSLRCCIPNCILSGRLDWFRDNEQEYQQPRLYESFHSSPSQKNKYYPFIEQDPVSPYPNHSQRERQSNALESEPTFKKINSPRDRMEYQASMDKNNKETWIDKSSQNAHSPFNQQQTKDKTNNQQQNKGQQLKRSKNVQKDQWIPPKCQRTSQQGQSQNKESVRANYDVD